jgi:uncharacterized protein involved in propanediol utilization
MTSAMITQLESIGTCSSSYGELLQGVLAGDEHFLVTLPINISSKATFIPDSISGIRVHPSSKIKTQFFVEKLNEAYGLNLSGTMTMQNEIPEGKGLSSSTADLVAALRAIENYLDILLPRNEIDAIFRSIEPSDGLLYPHSVVYKHRQCTLLRPLGHLPSLTIVSIDQGGTLDTVSYNKRPRVYTEHDHKTYASLLEKMTFAFEIDDLHTIGSIATESALLNQRFNFKPHLDGMLRVARQVKAYGVINTHSGTCLGLLIDPSLTHMATEELLKIFCEDNLAIYQTI